LLFRIYNHKYHTRSIHSGVIEFTAQEGRTYIPHWMMQNVRLYEGDLVTITTVHLPPATFVKLQPQSEDFLDITDPKAVLEQTLRKYAALTRGDMIFIRYNKKEYYLQVLDLKPKNEANACSIIEADVDVDFDPPVGYKEKKEVKEPPPIVEEKLIVHKDEIDPGEHLNDNSYDSDDEEEKPTFVAFSGGGSRISGKKADASNTASALTKTVAPQEEKKPVITVKGTVVYRSTSELEEIRKKKAEEHAKAMATKKEAEKAQQDQEKQFVAFSGKGHKLR